jgi:hypothetical protein
MAWSAPTIGAVTEDDNCTNGISVAPPSGTTAGKLLLLCVSTRPVGNGTTNSWSTPSGWTELHSKTYSGAKEIAVYGKLGGASESNVTVTASGSANICQGFMASFAGAPSSLTGIAVDTATSDNADYYDAHVDLPTPAMGTPPNTDCLIVYFGAASTTALGEACSVPNSATSMVQDTYSGGSGMGIYAAYAIQTTAANVAASLWDSSSGTTARTYALTLALIPGTAVKYLKLLAHSAAASATGVEGVVLNAARDTVIGEFTGQAFEASLEGSPGEAVLLIAANDITPDGATLTTSDAPIVFAYNSTDGTVGEGIASVIEV